MSCVVRLLSVLICIALARGSVYDGDYVPLFMVPHGYRQWKPDGITYVYSSIIHEEHVCQMRLIDQTLHYRLISPYSQVDTDFGLNRRFNGVFVEGTWIPLVALHGEFDLTPMLCFWYNDGPSFMVSLPNDHIMSITLENRTHIKTLDLTLAHELMAFDYVLNYVYTYENGRIYRMTTKEFMGYVEDLDFSWDNQLPVKHWTNSSFLDCTDMMVVENFIFLICEKSLIEIWQQRREVMLGEYGYEKFHHALLKAYKSNLPSQWDIFDVAAVATTPKPITTSTEIVIKEEIMPVEIFHDSRVTLDPTVEDRKPRVIYFDIPTQKVIETPMPLALLIAAIFVISVCVVFAVCYLLWEHCRRTALPPQFECCCPDECDRL